MFNPGDRVSVAFDGHVERQLPNGWIGVVKPDGLIHWVQEDSVKERA